MHVQRMFMTVATSRKKPTPPPGGEQKAVAPPERGGGPYGGITEDYKPEFAFFEAVDCVRKLTLALLGAVWRGTDMQVYIVALTSFIFAMLYVALQPYYLTKSNHLKLAAEAQVQPRLSSMRPHGLCSEEMALITSDCCLMALITSDCLSLP